jgi:DNA-binding transcriptional ArsR family regulator
LNKRGAQVTDDRTYWIMEHAQLAVLASPRRLDIVDALAAAGPLSVRELAAQIGARPSALYHHLALVIEAGLVVEAGTRIVNRKRETLYATPAPRMRLIRALAEGRHQEEMDEIVAALARQMERDFRAAGTMPGRCAQGEERNYGFFRLLARPGPEHLAAINARLQEIAEILWAADDPAADPVCLAWVMTPLDSRAD